MQVRQIDLVFTTVVRQSLSFQHANVAGTSINHHLTPLYFTHLSAVEALMMTSVRGLQTDTILERRMDGVSMAGRLSETVTFVERLQKR